MIQRINPAQVRAGINRPNVREGKQTVLAKLMPRIENSAKRMGTTASKLGTNRVFVMAQSMMNLEKLLKRNGINVRAGMTNSVGTATSGLAGHIARFVSLISADILVNLTAYDHVAVFPMKARNCVFVYPKYVYGTNKGEYRQGGLIRDVFEATKQSSTYISKNVTREAYMIAAADDEVTFVPETPNPIVGTLSITVGSETVTQGTGGTWAVGTAFTVTEVSGEITVELAAAATADTTVQLTYAYNNEQLPRAMVPTINVELGRIQLEAEFFQIQIAYDMYADFEADNDYGFSIKSELPEQAALEVKAEIDRLVYDKLYTLSDSNTTPAESTLLTVDFTEGDETKDFSDVIKYRLGKLISRFNQTFLDRTKKQGLKNLIFGASALDVLYAVVDSAADQTEAFGPYKLGVFKNIGIYIDPELGSTTTLSIKSVPVIGVAKSKDGKRAPLVLGEYMPLVPTNQLNLPDFTSMQGFATACCVEELNGVLVALGTCKVSE